MSEKGKHKVCCIANKRVPRPSVLVWVILFLLKKYYIERFPWAVGQHCRPVFALNNPEERIYLMFGSQGLRKPAARGLLSSIGTE